MGDLKLQDGQTVVFIGDSITDCGRRGDFAPFGLGYMSKVMELVTARYPERRLTYVNTGVGGHTVRELWPRWQEDVIDHQPDWLSVMVGINDVHRFLGAPAEKKIDVAEYEDTYRKMLSTTREQTSAKIVLMESFYLSPDPEHVSNRTLAEYLAVVHTLADEYDALLVPTHADFQKALKVRAPEDWSEDNVHPFPCGHALIALSWLRVMGW
jgi:lysophospholipase L1-like esterase